MSLSEQDGSFDRLLNAGVEAARKGDKALAQRLLLQVVEQDERNERAWLWLSSVVEAYEDRLVCLENVLAINPDSLPAKRGLNQLKSKGITAEKPSEPSPHAPLLTATEEGEVVEYVFRKELPPISAAAAVLYPERQVMELRWQERTTLHSIPAVTYESHTAYNDVWEKESEICAYCACEVEYDATHCPQCKRKLLTSQFTFAKPSADLIVYFVLIVGTAQLYFVQALVDLIVQAPLLEVAWHIILFLVLLGLSGGIALRRFWAYSASIVILVLIFSIMLLDAVVGLPNVNLVTTPSGLQYFEALAASPFLTLIRPVLDYLPSFQMLAVFLALVYGIFKAGPDFERIRMRLIAQVGKGLNDASAFYSAGKFYADKGMWASAVLHFQRAAANEPNRAYYHLATGKAYAQLGFKERARDAYTSARRLATTDKMKAEIDTAIGVIGD